MRFLQVAAIGLLVVGCVVLLCFLNKSSLDGFVISNGVHTDYQVTGQFGDFVGGVVGTFFALSGTLLIFLNFKEQAKENKRSAFESSYFEMIRLYRENVGELKYVKGDGSQEHVFENRQVLREIYKEFVECYREIKKFSNSTDESYYITSSYSKKLKAIALRQNRKISIIEMAIIDLAFTIVFYGLSDEGLSLVRGSALRKYQGSYYFKVVYFIRMKPKRSNESRFLNWMALVDPQYKLFHQTINDLYASRKKPGELKSAIPLANSFKMELPYEKYYGGHQFRLGHYFRHMYQSFMYLDRHLDVSNVEKYQYAKLYRAQLSTYEQALLLVNSISSLGMKWELLFCSIEDKSKKVGLITKYNLIKNLPGRHLSGIYYRTYYPGVEYESDDEG